MSRTGYLLLGLFAFLGGCPGQNHNPGHAHRAQDSSQQASGPAGGSCSGRTDCPQDQLCSEGICRHIRTSREGEILAVGARNQMAAGDYVGALHTFEEALAAFTEADVPMPPQVACGAAVAALRLTEDEASRERAALAADRCFRNSPPGFLMREEVQSRVAMFRFDGIDLTLFDAPEPPQAFFVEEPTRPTADAIQISIDLPASTVTGFEELQEALLGEPARVTISSCFVKDWERHHERSVTAALVLRFRTRLKDMGDYDVFAPEIAVTAGTEAPGPFEACLAEGLTDTLQPGPRVGRTVTAWQEAFNVQTSVP